MPGPAKTQAAPQQKKQPAKVQEPKQRHLVVLRPTSAAPAPTELQCLQVCNAINKRLGKAAVLGVRVTKTGNLALTPSLAIKPSELITSYSQWQAELRGAFNMPSVPDQWVKLIAHGIPAYLQEAGPIAEVFCDELQLHQLQVMGSPY